MLWRNSCLLPLAIAMFLIIVLAIITRISLVRVYILRPSTSWSCHCVDH